MKAGREPVCVAPLAVSMMSRLLSTLQREEVTWQDSARAAGFLLLFTTELKKKCSRLLNWARLKRFTCLVKSVLNPLEVIIRMRCMLLCSNTFTARLLNAEIELVFRSVVYFSTWEVWLAAWFKYRDFKQHTLG